MLMVLLAVSFFFFFFNDTATTEIYTLSLHDALPICFNFGGGFLTLQRRQCPGQHERLARKRSEEHTSELQSPCNLVCRLLLEKKKNAAYQRRYFISTRVCPPAIRSRTQSVRDIVVRN